jgi:hypothetical protein
VDKSTFPITKRSPDIFLKTERFPSLGFKPFFDLFVSGSIVYDDLEVMLNRKGREERKGGADSFVFKVLKIAIVVMQLYNKIHG